MQFCYFKLIFKSEKNTIDIWLSYYFRFEKVSPFLKEKKPYKLRNLHQSGFTRVKPTFY